MERVKFEVSPPLPGYMDAPLITAEQMSRLLYASIGSEGARKLADILNNGAFYPNMEGQLQRTYAAPIDWHLEDDRPNWQIGDTVRCISKSLRDSFSGSEFFGEPGQDYVIADFYCDNGVSDAIFVGGGSGARERFYRVVKAAPKFLKVERPVRVHDLEIGDVLRYCGHESHGTSVQLEIGAEYTVSEAWRRRFIAAGSGWYGSGWSFVRRPGFAVVRDGYVKNGDTVYWLGRSGLEVGVVGDPAWEASNRENIGYAPWAYQKTPPNTFIEYGRSPEARYAYLDLTDGALRNSMGAV